MKEENGEAEKKKGNYIFENDGRAESWCSRAARVWLNMDLLGKMGARSTR